MKCGKYFLAGVLALSASPAFAEILTFQEGVGGYAGTQDTHIISWDGNQNQLTRLDDGSNGGNGGATATTGGHPQNAGGHIYIEQGDYGTTKPLLDDSKAILIKFDLAGITGTVNSARIGLHYWYERSTGNVATQGSGTKLDPNTLYVNRVLKRWEEGNGGATSGVDGDDAADNSGVVTWNSTGFELWQAMGAEGPEDIAPPEDVVVFDPIEVFFQEGDDYGWVWFDVTESAAIWVADPSQNNGVKISQEPYPTTFLTPDLTLPNGTVVYRGSPTATPGDFEPGAHNYVSSENTMVDLRPKLVLDINRSSTDIGSWSLY